MAKHSLTLSLLLILSCMGLSYSRNGMAETRTAFGAGISSFGIYLSPNLRITSLQNDLNYLVGGQLVSVINHRLTMGLAGYSTSKTIGISAHHMTYAGVNLGYMHRPASLIHPSFQIFMGYGGLKNGALSTQFYDGLIVFESTAMLNLNLLANLRLGMGLNYRFVDGIAQNNLNSSELHGLGFAMDLKLGGF
ncbi:MAG: hypothetical protein OEY38_12455 [Gammaproteobacteria bacterium]|nr:hypothetical protein [Gammaproteobacteria bacterium]